jgi:hypothetical protein
MSPRDRPTKSPKFLTHRSLLIAGESPLSHSPGYLVKCRVNRLESNPAGYSPRYPVRNPESYWDNYPASYWAGHLPESPLSNREDCLDSNSAGSSDDCPDNRLERNPESNLPSNGAGNSPDNSESNSVDSLPDCSASYPESFDPLSVRREAKGGSSRSLPEPSPKSTTGAIALLDTVPAPLYLVAEVLSAETNRYD